MLNPITTIRVGLLTNQLQTRQMNVAAHDSFASLPIRQPHHISFKSTYVLPHALDSKLESSTPQPMLRPLPAVEDGEC